MCGKGQNLIHDFVVMRLKGFIKELFEEASGFLFGESVKIPLKLNMCSFVQEATCFPFVTVNNHNLVEVVPSRHVRASELFLLAQIMFCNFEIVEYHVARECFLVPQLHDIKWDSNCSCTNFKGIGVGTEVVFVRRVRQFIVCQHVYHVMALPLCSLVIEMGRHRWSIGNAQILM